MLPGQTEKLLGNPFLTRVTTVMRINHDTSLAKLTLARPPRHPARLAFQIMQDKRVMAEFSSNMYPQTWGTFEPAQAESNPDVNWPAFLRRMQLLKLEQSPAQK